MVDKKVNEGDFLLVDYTIRYDKDGKKVVFDTTDKKIAEKEGCEFPRNKFDPLFVILGDTPIFKGFEKALKEAEIGKKTKIKIHAKEAFGEKKDPKLIQTVNKNLFGKNAKLYVGMEVQGMDGTIGRIISIEGNRVTIDFNHPLAGKDIELEFKIIKKLDKETDKLKELGKMIFGNDKFEVKKTKNGYEVILEKENYLRKDILLKKAELLVQAKKYLNIDEIKYSEIWSDKE